MIRRGRQLTPIETDGNCVPGVYEDEGVVVGRDCKVFPLTTENDDDRKLVDLATNLFGRDSPEYRSLQDESCAIGCNCAFDHGSLGCTIPSCEVAVCAADSFCCTTAWDSICSDLACGSLCTNTCAECLTCTPSLPGPCGVEKFALSICALGCNINCSTRIADFESCLDRACPSSVPSSTPSETPSTGPTPDPSCSSSDFACVDKKGKNGVAVCLNHGNHYHNFCDTTGETLIPGQSMADGKPVTDCGCCDLDLGKVKKPKKNDHCNYASVRGRKLHNKQGRSDWSAVA